MERNLEEFLAPWLQSSADLWTHPGHLILTSLPSNGGSSGGNGWRLDTVAEGPPGRPWLFLWSAALPSNGRWRRRSQWTAGSLRDNGGQAASDPTGLWLLKFAKFVLLTLDVGGTLEGVRVACRVATVFSLRSQHHLHYFPQGEICWWGEHPQQLWQPVGRSLIMSFFCLFCVSFLYLVSRPRVRICLCCV